MDNDTRTGTVKATVSKSSGGNGFDGPRREKTRTVTLDASTARVGEIVREGPARGWLITAIN